MDEHEEAVARRLAHDVVLAYLSHQQSVTALGLPPGDAGPNLWSCGYFNGLAAAAAVALSWTPGPDDVPSLTLQDAIRQRDRELGGRPDRHPEALSESHEDYVAALEDVVLRGRLDMQEWGR